MQNAHVTESQPCMVNTDIDQRYQTSCTALRNGIVNQGAQIETNANKMHLQPMRIYAQFSLLPVAAFHTFSTSWSGCSTYR